MKKELTGLKSAIIIFISVIFFGACEKEYIPNLPTQATDIVVEGYIETGQNPNPTYVILTHSVPFFRTLSNTSNIFERNAEIYVSNGKDSTRLQELCWQDLTLDSKKQAGAALGINSDSTTKDFNFCVYADISQKIKAKIGETYSLRVKLADGRVLTSSTTLPRLVPIDSLIFIKPPGINQNDTFAQCRASVNDPKGPDFYRYLTAINNKVYIAGSNTVTDDAFFDGQIIKFNLFKSEPRNSKTDASIYGLWHRGDTVSIKFCNIDKATFDFWNTLEYNARNGGPFSSYTKVKHNISGGLGIWSGATISYIDTIVPKK